MKISWETVLSVLLALLIWKVLDRLVVEPALAMVLPNTFDDYDDLDDLDDDLDNFTGKIVHRGERSALRRNSERKGLLKQAHHFSEELNNFDDYEDDYENDLEDGDALEMLDEYEDHVQKFTKRSGSPAQGRASANRHMSAKYGKKWNKAQAKGKSRGLRGKTGSAQYNAYVNLIVTRTSANNAVALPFILFAANQLTVDYVDILKLYIPSGITLTSVTIDVSGNIVFTYADTATGLLIDTVVISCNQVAYASFMTALITDQFDCEKVRYVISDATQLSQFSQKFQWGKKSLFGQAKQNDFPVNMHKSPKDYQAGIIDIPQPFSVDKEGFMAGNIIAVGGFSIELNLFITNYFKYNAKSVLNAR